MKDAPVDVSSYTPPFRHFLWSLFFILTTAGSTAQVSEFIDAQYVGYTGRFEKDLFQHANDHSVDHRFRLLLSASPVDGAAIFNDAFARFNRWTEAYKSPAFMRKPLKARLKILDKGVRADWFRAFTQEGRFDQLFIDGRYNSYTACAFYGLLLDTLGIPYEVRQEEEEVYLVVSPGPEQQELRFPDPARIRYTVDENIKKAFLTFIGKVKPESQNETDGEALFNQFYYGKALIRLENIAGQLYLYSAFQEIRNQHAREALDMALKSCMLNPGDRQNFYAVSMLGDCFRKASFDTDRDWVLFPIAAWFLGNGVKADEIIGEFSQLTQSQLINNSKIDLYHKSSEFILSRIQDLSLRTELAYISEHEKGRYYLAQANYIEAGKCFENAFQLKPKNIEAQSAFINTLTPVLSSLIVNERLKKMREYELKFPNLNTNGTFEYIYLHSMMEYFTQLYDNMEGERAEEVRLRFEKRAADNKSVNLHQYAVGEAYTSAALYYFKKGQTAKARAILKKGLELSPDNELLKYRLNSI